jgi:hypothetical protein
MENKNKARILRGVKDEIWQQFSGLARLKGMKQAEFFEEILRCYIKHNAKKILDNVGDFDEEGFVRIV